MLIDTHCHLFYDDLKNDLPGVLDRAHDLGLPIILQEEIDKC